MEVEGRRQRGRPKKKVEGLHRRRPEGERIEGRGCWGPGLVEKTSEEQRPHMNMGAAAEEEVGICASIHFKPRNVPEAQKPLLSPLISDQQLFPFMST